MGRMSLPPGDDFDFDDELVFDDEESIADARTIMRGRGDDWPDLDDEGFRFYNPPGIIAAMLQFLGLLTLVMIVVGIGLFIFLRQTPAPPVPPGINVTVIRTTDTATPVLATAAPALLTGTIPAFAATLAASESPAPFLTFDMTNQSGTQIAALATLIPTVDFDVLTETRLAQITPSLTPSDTPLPATMTSVPPSATAMPSASATPTLTLTPLPTTSEPTLDAPQILQTLAAVQALTPLPSAIMPSSAGTEAPTLPPDSAPRPSATPRLLPPLEPERVQSGLRTWIALLVATALRLVRG
jgi:hypothetical protein